MHSCSSSQFVDVYKEYFEKGIRAVNKLANDISSFKQYVETVPSSLFFF
jgi:hypothetical protein